jgi:hypothetical protein
LKLETEIMFQLLKRVKTNYLGVRLFLYLIHSIQHRTLHLHTLAHRVKQFQTILSLLCYCTITYEGSNPSPITPKHSPHSFEVTAVWFLKIELWERDIMFSCSNLRDVSQLT